MARISPLDANLANYRDKRIKEQTLFFLKSTTGRTINEILEYFTPQQNENMEKKLSAVTMGKHILGRKVTLWSLWKIQSLGSMQE